MSYCKAGDTYLMKDPDSPYEHLRIILCDPYTKNTDSEEYIIMVYLTTYNHWKDPTVLLDIGDHPYITNKSCISYKEAIETKVKNIEDAEFLNYIEPKQPVSDEILEKIIKGAYSSDFTENKIINMLKKHTPYS